jgi:hypothetical protein
MLRKTSKPEKVFLHRSQMTLSAAMILGVASEVCVISKKYGNSDGDCRARGNARGCGEWSSASRDAWEQDFFTKHNIRNAEEVERRGEGE